MAAGDGCKNKTDHGLTFSAARSYGRTTVDQAFINFIRAGVAVFPGDACVALDRVAWGWYGRRKRW